MGERVTAKVKVTGRTVLDDGQVSIHIEPDYNENGRNAEWAKYTPALQLNMNVKGEVSEFFETGAELTLTFEK